MVVSHQSTSQRRESLLLSSDPELSCAARCVSKSTSECFSDSARNGMLGGNRIISVEGLPACLDVEDESARVKRPMLTFRVSNPQSEVQEANEMER